MVFGLGFGLGLALAEVYQHPQKQPGNIVCGLTHFLKNLQPRAKNYNKFFFHGYHLSKFYPEDYTEYREHKVQDIMTEKKEAMKARNNATMAPSWHVHTIQNGIKDISPSQEHQIIINSSHKSTIVINL